MSNDTQPNEFLEILKGGLLLLGFHALVGALIFIGGFIVGMIAGGYSFITVWAIGAMGFFFWQLLYAIPLIMWLKRRNKTAMVKGVIIIAVITALLNGTCWLSLQGGF